MHYLMIRMTTIIFNILSIILNRMLNTQYALNVYLLNQIAYLVDGYRNSEISGKRRYRFGSQYQ